MGAELFPDFALCLPLLIFPYGDHISRARWQGAVDHTPRLQVPPLGHRPITSSTAPATPSRSFAIFQRFFSVHMEHRDFDWTSLSAHLWQNKHVEVN